MIHKILAGILLGVSLAAPVGPVSVEVIRRGSISGFNQAFLTGLGAATADSCYLALMSFGLRNFPYLKIIGSAILIIMGISSVFAKDVKTKHKSKSSFISGCSIALFNPMTAVWWIGVFGVISKYYTFPESFSVIAGVILWFALLSTILHYSKSFVKRILRPISIVAGIVLILYGVLIWF